MLKCRERGAVMKIVIRGKRMPPFTPTFPPKTVA
jgi:hypothetical protein